MVEFKKVKYDGFSDYVIKVKRAGKSKIKIKTKGAKAVKTTITAYKYTNAFSTFKVGDKSYKDYYKKGFIYENKAEGAALKGKIDIKAAKGWKLTGISYYDMDTGESKQLKNGDEVNITNGAIYVEMKHKKSKIYWMAYNRVGNGY